MRLIIGLGNPGDKYKNNRHNVGYLLVEKFKTQNIKNIIAVKTNTFMNDSGSSVKEYLLKYSLKNNDLYIVHDDLDIPLGSYKIQFGKGPKDHKGLASIDNEIGSDYWHIRIGVDNRNPENRIPGEEYILQDFTEEERKILDKVILEICKNLATS